jgi:hypothetical protein
MWAMRRINAAITGAAMLIALLTAPLFHVHDADDHGHDAAFVHAHFPEFEHASSSAASEIENEHSHEHARAIDVFTLSVPTSVPFQAIAEYSEPLVLPALQIVGFLEPVHTLHSHGPPPQPGSAPRPPPAC